MKLNKVLSAALIAGLLVSSSGTLSVSANTDNRLIESYEREIDELKNKEKDTETGIENKEREIDSLIIEIEMLENNRLDVERDIENNEKKIKSAENEIRKVQDEIDELQESIDERAEIVGNRMKRYQSDGKISYLDVIFGSENLIDMFTRIHSVTEIIKADNSIIDNFVKDVKKVEEQLKKVEKLKEDLNLVKKENERKVIELEKNISIVNANREELDRQLEELNTDFEEIKSTQDELLDKVNKELGMKVGMGKGELEWPTDDGYISSGIGVRTHPKTGEASSFHRGIDIARTNRSLIPPIYSAEDGVVIAAGVAGTYGNMVKVRHESGLETLYGHLSTIRVKVGQEVRRGQTIGVMGSTGRSTGVHLHFEVYQNGKLQNPLRYIGSSGS